MNTLYHKAKRQWIDDHLDLLLYAQHIQDDTWTAEIMSYFQQAETEILSLSNRLYSRQLTKEFDDINAELLSIFSSTRHDLSKRGNPSIVERIVELKKRRSHIIDLFREGY